MSWVEGQKWCWGRWVKEVLNLPQGGQGSPPPQEGNMSCMLKDENGQGHKFTDPLCTFYIWYSYSPSHLLSILGISAVSCYREQHASIALHSSCYLKACSFSSVKILWAGGIFRMRDNSNIAIVLMHHADDISLLRDRALVLETQNLWSEWILSHSSSFRFPTSSENLDSFLK